LHESADRQWLFITSERYSAWIETRFVGVGDADTVFGYGGHGPHRVVTGATASTTFTPEEPRVSRLQLDMGVRLPVLADWPVQTPVNGQQAHASHVVQLPVRNEDGSLALVPALIARAEDTAPEYLNLTPRNLLNQAFKFLGERYGWGHSYDTRDCSGFVSEVYRSFGILLPRNTSAQAVSPALDRIAFTAKDDKARRIAAVQQLQLGNLVYIPGHVMMTIGRINGQTWVIHDTAGGSWFGPDGKRVQAHLNGVSVTPLEPMMASDTVSYIDRITNIQRIRPQTP
ncbi:MAG: NlpC/P60 family protein, partial [Stenotrophomonas sp.]